MMRSAAVKGMIAAVVVVAAAVIVNSASAGAGTWESRSTSVAEAGEVVFSSIGLCGRVELTADVDHRELATAQFSRVADIVVNAPEVAVELFALDGTTCTDTPAEAGSLIITHGWTEEPCPEADDFGESPGDSDLPRCARTTHDAASETYSQANSGVSFPLAGATRFAPDTDIPWCRDVFVGLEATAAGDPGRIEAAAAALEVCLS